MRRRQAIWALAAALGAGQVLSAKVTVTVTPAVFRHLYALHGHGRVEIQNPYGNVSITAWDRDAVLVEAVKHAGVRSGAEDVRIVVDSSADSLSVRTQYAGSDIDRPTSVEFRITVPRGVHLENVSLTNGQLLLDGLSGPVKASSVNGDIHALKLGGQVELSTVNGKVEAAFERTDPTHSISVSSVNGPIRLTIPTGADASVEAMNLSGGIASDLGRGIHSLGGHRLIVRGSGPQIRLHNVNGGISIHGGECPCT